MDFFDQQEQARRRSRALLCSFGAAVALQVVVICLVLGSVLQVLIRARSWQPLHLLAEALNAFALLLLSPSRYGRWLWNPTLFGTITAGTLLSILLGSVYKIRRLTAEGGGAVAELLGGRRVAPMPDAAAELQLRHVVEEMAIASGVAVPEIYVLDNERGINAFSAGYTRNDLIIAVTRGCVQLLNRDELQGVIAHEFSHILNGDTRLNMELMGIVHGMLWPTVCGRVLVWGDAEVDHPDDAPVFDRQVSGRLPLALPGFLLLALGAAGLPLARWIKSAICRKRELLADAAAIQFTRNPDGIAGALKKVGGLAKNGRLDSPHAETASHLCFVNFGPDPWLVFLSSHPPLLSRVRAIEPGFDGRYPLVRMLPPTQAERDRVYETALGFTLQLEKAGAAGISPAAEQLAVERIRQVGLMRMNLPPDIAAATRTASQAVCLVYLLLLDPDQSVRAKQLGILQSQSSGADTALLASLLPLKAGLEDRYRLPLIELSVPALRLLDPDATQALLDTARQLAEADGAIDLFEYALLRLLERRLLPGRPAPFNATSRISSAKALIPECRVLISALAWLGRESEPAATAAFRQGSQSLDLPDIQLSLLPRPDCGLERVDQALNRATAAAPYLKRNILFACARTVTCDNQVDAREMEMLHAIADTLECPVPSFVQALAQA